MNMLLHRQITLLLTLFTWFNKISYIRVNRIPKESCSYFFVCSSSSIMERHCFRSITFTYASMNILNNFDLFFFLLKLITILFLSYKNCPFSIENFLHALRKFDLFPQSFRSEGYSLVRIKCSISFKWKCSLFVIFLHVPPPLRSPQKCLISFNAIQWYNPMERRVNAMPWHLVLIHQTSLNPPVN